MTQHTLMPFTDITLELPGRTTGKVRVMYALPGEHRLLVTTDRLSAFDKVVAAVPFKGQVLNQLSWWWFETTRDLVDNHALAQPDPNALVAREATVLPVEVVVRRRITGVTSTSLWRQYAEGARVIYGHEFPDGLRKNEALPEAIITPTTKAAHGAHDEPLTCTDVTAKGLVEPELWEKVQAVALALFARGEAVAERAGLVLADTKYEFGLHAGGRLLLIDEVHTPDSSRWWVADGLDARLAAGHEPESLDKEPVRRALADSGYGGDGPPPELGAEVWEATTRRYIDAYERITGLPFEPGEYPVEPRLAANLGAWLGQERTSE
jgi:phosphoribosylaminoimidazole-succinocarboxamide synthase